jgi:type IV pilus assembly protein PilN
MIRINLLPVRQVKKVQAGQRQLLIFAMVLVAEFAVMFFIYSWKASEVEAKQRTVTQLEADVARLKNAVGDFDQIQSQRDRLIAQKNIINTLQKARTGPVWMMRELSNILTAGKGPTFDTAKYEMILRSNPASAFEPNWNPNRLWIETFDEKGGNVVITGKAKDYDDVAEFLKRLSISKYFLETFLERNDQVLDAKMNIKVVKFSLHCRTAY